MPTGDTKQVEQIRDDRYKRLLQRYEDRSSAFRKSFGGLLVFALLFLLIVLVPYVTLQREKHRVAAALGDLTPEVAQRQERLEAYRAPQRGIARLREEIRSGPGRLREFIVALQVPEGSGTAGRQGIQQMLPSPIQMPLAQQAQQANVPLLPQGAQVALPSGPCESLRGEEFFSCLVKHEVLSQFAAYRTILAQDVLKPLVALRGAAGEPIDPQAADTALAEMRAAFERRLEANPRFWRTVAGKAGLAVELDAEVQRFWEEVGAKIERTARVLEQELTGLRAKMNALLGRQKALESQHHELAARLKEIESPLGKLPVGLAEAVLIFPLMLAVGFVLCASLLAEATRLRRGVHRLLREGDPAGEVTTDAEIALLAPLWLDPLDPEQHRPLRLALLLTPVAAFLVASALIGYSWTLPDSPGGSATLTRWIYGGLYVVSLGAFVYGARQVAAEVRRYPSVRNVHATGT